MTRVINAFLKVTFCVFQYNQILFISFDNQSKTKNQIRIAEKNLPCFVFSPFHCISNPFAFYSISLFCKQVQKTTKYLYWCTGLTLTLKYNCSCRPPHSLVLLSLALYLLIVFSTNSLLIITSNEIKSHLKLLGGFKSCFIC